MEMSSKGSVSQWLAQIQKQDADDKKQIDGDEMWNRYILKLVEHAGKKRHLVPRGVKNEEDVALEALESFWSGISQDKFPRLRDRHDLWKLLVKITDCRAKDYIRFENRQKRFGGKVKGESALLVSREPTPEFAASTNEQLEYLLTLLDGQKNLREIAKLKLQNYTNDEIAVKFGCTTRTVERKLELIRKLWNKLMG